MYHPYQILFSRIPHWNFERSLLVNLRVRLFLHSLIQSNQNDLVAGCWPTARLIAGIARNFVSFRNQNRRAKQDAKDCKNSFGMKSRRMDHSLTPEVAGARTRGGRPNMIPVSTSTGWPSRK